MLRRTQIQTAPIVLWAAQALGWKPVQPKTPFLSSDWCAERDLISPEWRTSFNELATEEPELPQEPDEERPLSGMTIGVGDDLDVEGFVTTYGIVAPTMFHTRPQADQPFVAWMRNHGAFVTGKLRVTTPFSRTENATLAEHPAALAVAAKACDIALTGSIMGPAAVAAPMTANVFAFKPSAAALPSFNPPFSRRYSFGFVTRHVGVAEKLWTEMVGRNKVTSEWDDGGYDYLRVPVPDYLKDDYDDEAMMLKKSHGADITPTIKVGIPVGWINEVLAKPGAGEALAEGLQTKMKAKILKRDRLQNSFTRRMMWRLGQYIASTVEAGRSRMMHHQGGGAGGGDKTASDQNDKKSNNNADPSKPSATTPQKKKDVIVNIDVQTVALNWDVEAVIDLVQTIINYELCEALEEKKLSEASGLLEQLPKETRDAIAAGKQITEKQYQNATAQVRLLRQDLFDEMSNVDCLCLPMLSPPFENQHLRSIGFALPFSLIGCSCAAFRLPLGSVSKYSAIKRVGVEDGDDVDGAAAGLKLLRGNAPLSFASHAAKSQNGDGSSSSSSSSATPLSSSASSSTSRSKSRTAGGKLSLPLLLVAEPGQDSVILEAAKSLINRVE